MADNFEGIAGLTSAYARGVSPRDVFAKVFSRIGAVDDPGIFITLFDYDAVLAEADQLGAFDPARLLWGIPFVVKDNIDVAGVSTTAGCHAFAYTPAVDAEIVARLRAAGAIPVGKTNLDQFATGLVGMRSPYPPPRNAIDAEIVPGGSSSGSAVAVAQGIVPFAVGTDTAGSGRVPAALNGIVGLKPSLGALSNRGIVPACKTLDTASIFAHTVEDAWTVLTVAAGYDPKDSFSRGGDLGSFCTTPPKLRIAAPAEVSLDFNGDAAQSDSFQASLATLESLGATIERIDFAPFYEVARLLYDGPWIAERYTVLQDLLETDPAAIHPVTRAVVSSAQTMTATDVFRALYRLADLRREIEPMMARVDALCTPSTPDLATVAELAEDPIGPNTRMGTFTNFVNLLDLCALTVPTAPRRDGFPGSATLVGRRGCDGIIASIGAALTVSGDARPTTTCSGSPRSVTSVTAPDEIALAVCGVHMSGLALNRELTDRGGRFLRTARTEPKYRLYALPGGPPRRPGLVQDPSGAAIELELWALPSSQIGPLLVGVSEPLGVGRIVLEDGTTPLGFLCEAIGAAGAEDVTAYGGWRSFLADKEQAHA